MQIELLDSVDFEKQRRVVELYSGIYPIAPVLHQVLTGVAGMWMYVAVEGSEVLGAGVLKSAEAVMPVGPDVKPLAFAVSDMATAPRYRRRHVATQLLERMAAIAYANGGRILYLYTDVKNEPAIQLYRNYGLVRLRDQSNQAVFVRLLGGEYGAD